MPHPAILLDFQEGLEQVGDDVARLRIERGLVCAGCRRRLGLFVRWRREVRKGTRWILRLLRERHVKTIEIRVQRFLVIRRWRR